jgi:hypothetical protein
MNLRMLLLLMAILILSSCRSVEYPPDKAPRMLVVNDAAEFFLHGPAQGNGANRSLAKGDEVQVLRKEFGYSFVQLSDGQKGYVANDALVIAPPMPSPTPLPSSDAATNFWPKEKSFSDFPAAAADSNAPIAPPVFRY